ncbi:MAG TPA: DUF5615 family PIN-like protein [Chthonomonadaceae bacterium]|nr:DUF5615 family PIN-like protein [Chthonomonadaceae bacterium]
MLAYLLDQQISPAVAEQLQAKNPQIRVTSVHRWQEGAFVGQAGALLLRAAAQEGLTLVTYDLKTFPDLLAAFAAENEAHSGVLFVDDATLRSDDYGGLVRALLAHWQTYQSLDWNNRIAFLQPA